MPQRLPLIPSPSMLLVRRAMLQGVFGRSRGWKAVAFVIIGTRILRRLEGLDPRTVATETLRPGDTLVLRGVTSRELPRR